MATDRPLDAWMLPGELARAADPSVVNGSPGRRTGRDWAVDVAFFLLAVAVWLGERYSFLAEVPLPRWLFLADLSAGALLCLALWWRRRFPVALGVVAVAVAAFSNTATGAVLVAFFNLAVHRGWRWSVPMVPAALLLGAPYVWEYFPGYLGLPLVWMLLIGATLSLSVAAGLAVRARRQVVLALREQTDAVRRESELRLEKAREAERDGLAREMHDVLAHRISLLAVHAGALEFRAEQSAAGKADPPTPEELQESAGVVRRNAHVALEELRGVLHVLRAAEPDHEPTAPPQPGLDQVADLVEEVTASGQRVELTLDVAGIPDAVGRTVYRVVQEGMTNARKHAPGAGVRVSVRTDEGCVVVAVTNPVPVGVTEGELAGARVGLHGLAERVRIHRDGARTGTLEHGLRDGVFRLEARIPWVP
ncbi:histidine kinase [Georgenia halophila]|uniref:histidine kinase n=1 Tax=Georgenia halophila TaxID=620889 RepID=A0ABP8KYX3_9MICO